MSGKWDNRDRRRNQTKALIFMLAVAACFAVCMILTSGIIGGKKGENGEVLTAPAEAGAAGPGEDAYSISGTEPADEGQEPGQIAEAGGELSESGETGEAQWTEETGETGEAEVIEGTETNEGTGETEEAEATGETTASDDSGSSYTAVWDLDALPNDLIPYGYVRENRNEANVPTDMFWYDAQWGQYNVDWIQDTEQNVIYLTMDEGFPNDTTAVILDILRDKDVKAVFFLTKQFVDEMPEMVQRMIDEGHQIGNHTCSHPTMPELSVEEQVSEIMTLQEQVKEQFGYDMKYFRFPEGAFSERSLGLVDNLGMKTVFWSYAYNDYSEEQPPIEESLQLALNELHPGAIYLLHANSTTNAAFLADWIDTCRERGFEFGIYPETPNV